MGDPYNYAKAEQEYYSDRLREQGIEECEWHPGYNKQFCSECEGAYEAWQENLMDAEREERGDR